MTALTLLIPDSGRYNVGCTKRVGLFHTDRSKLQKAGATTHNRRRASKASLPTLTKDTKKQVGSPTLRSPTLRSPLLTPPRTPTVLLCCWHRHALPCSHFPS